MKKITVTFILTIMLLTCFTVMKNAMEVEKTTEKVIRVHIIANSDSLGDQELKLKVRDGVTEAAAAILEGCSDKQDALRRLAENINEIKKAAQDVIKKNGEKFEVSCNLGRENFGSRVYDSFTLPAGKYDSLTVRIGEARGGNWWCVCYPEICLGASSSIDDCAVFTEDELKILKTPKKVRYKLFCYEIFLRVRRMITGE